MTLTEERPVTAVAASPPLDAAALRALVREEHDEDRLRVVVGDGLAGLDDARERLRIAAAAAKTAQEQGDAARLTRNSAALQLAKTRKAVRVWKDTLGITRNLWNRILHDPKNQPGNFPDPETVAREASVESRCWDVVRDAAIVVRDETAFVLMNKEGARNAEIVRLTGLTSARVAQLRTS